MKLNSIALLLSIALCSATTSAAVVNINNASFENDSLIAGSWTNYVINGWTISGGGGAGTFNPIGSLPQGTYYGSNVAWSNGSSISQTLTATLAANTVYTLSVDLLNRSQIQNQSSTLAFYAGNNLLASTVIRGGAPSTAVLQSLTFSTGISNSFVGQNLKVLLVAGGAQSDWDNVQLTAVAAVPEPETYAMLLAGLGMIGAAVKRRKAKQG